MDAVANDVAGRNLRSSVGLLTDAEVSEMLSVTVDTLATWRRESQGPDFAKLGKSVFYRRQDIIDWIAVNVSVVQRKAS